MKTFFSFLFLWLSIEGISQTTFQKVYKHPDNPSLLKAQSTFDKGYILIGGIGVGITENIYLIKTDSTGNKEWAKVYETSLGGWANCIIQTSDNKYVFGGLRGSKTYLTKMDDTGKILWSKSYGGVTGFTSARYIKQTSDKGYIVLGDAVGVNTIINNAIYLLKVDSTGSIQWSKTYNTLGDWGAFIFEGKDKNFIIGGVSLYKNPSIASSLLMNLDSTGNPIWIKTYGTNMSFSKYYPANDGGHIFGGNQVTGQTSGPFILKTDSLFNPIWAKRYSNNTTDAFHEVIQTSDSGYIISAETEIAPFNTDAMIIKADESGNIEWSKRIGRSGRDYISYIKQLQDTGYVMIGTTTDSLFINSAFYFVKTDSLGNTCFGNSVSPAVMNVPINVDTFSFNIGSLDSSDNIVFAVSYGGTDSLLCYNNGSNSIQDIEEKADITVYPNPAHGSINLVAKKEMLSVEIISIEGKIIFKREPTNYSIMIDISQQPNGIYFYRVKLKDHMVTGKIIKH